MIIYLCPKCNIDSAMCERDKPRCFYCENTEELTIIKKEALSIEVMAARMKLVNDRLMSSLQGAYFAGKEDDDFDDEAMLLQLMEKAQKLGIDTEGIFEETKKKK